MAVVSLSHPSAASLRMGLGVSATLAKSLLSSPVPFVLVVGTRGSAGIIRVGGLCCFICSWPDSLFSSLNHLSITYIFFRRHRLLGRVEAGWTACRVFGSLVLGKWGPDRVQSGLWLPGCSWCKQSWALLLSPQACAGAIKV